MEEIGSFLVEDFIQSITAQLDRVQDVLRVKALNRPLTYALKDFALDLNVFVEMDDDGNVRFRTSAPNETGASVVRLGFTTITKPMIEENTISLATTRSPSLEELGLEQRERRQLEQLGVRNAAQLYQLRSSTGTRAVSRLSGVPAERLRQAINLGRPMIDTVRPTDQPRPERPPSTGGQRPGRTRPDDGRPDTTRPGDTRPDRTRPGGTRPGGPLPDRIRPGRTLPDRPRPGLPDIRLPDRVFPRDPGLGGRSRPEAITRRPGSRLRPDQPARRSPAPREPQQAENRLEETTRRNIAPVIRLAPGIRNLSIMGANLDSPDGPPSVFLAGKPLALESIEDDEIIIDLPNDAANGDLLIQLPDGEAYAYDLQFSLSDEQPEQFDDLTGDFDQDNDPWSPVNGER